MPSQTEEFSLLIEFRYHPGGPRSASLLEALLPNGARFTLDPSQIHGKLGQNLQLFCQGAAQAAKPEGTQNVHTARLDLDESLITRVAPGTAYGGQSKQRDSDKKKAKLREAQDVLANLEITL